MIDASLFRATMRQLATGVAVITVRTREGRLHAMTATSFTPVSLEPPLLLICINRGGDTDAALADADGFGLTLLSEDQAELSTRFAGKGPERYRFDDLPLRRGPGGGAFLDGGAAFIEATLQERIVAGDHTLCLGRIDWATAFPERRPLVHHQGAYHRLQRLDHMLMRKVG